MSVIDRMYGMVESGRDPNRPKLKTKIEKLDAIIPGIRQGYSFLIGGDTGTGKTKLARGVFVDDVQDQVRRVNNPELLDCYIVDFTMEILPELNAASTLTREIFRDYQRVIPPTKILGWSDILSNEENTLVRSYRDYLNQYQSKVLTIDRETDPNMYHDTLMEVAKRFGRFSREGRYIDDCGTWTPTNPNLHIIVLFDTLNLAAIDAQHATIKSSIDRISKIGVRFRNKCGFIIVNIQQYNSDLATTDRARFGVQGPNLKDHMDSSGPTKDATVVLGLYSPMRYLRDEQVMWRGYDVSILKNWLVSLHVLKNRYGLANKYIPLKFDGAVGNFTQLPEAREMGEEQYSQATRH